MDRRLTIRPATSADAAACARIYAPFVLDTAVTFETEAPSPDEMARRIAAAHVWLVAESDEPDDRIVGYAYAGTFRARPAYRWTCEVSAYVRKGHEGEGIGRALYEHLLATLTERGFRTAVAGMTMPNDASAGLHRALGFEPVGTYREVGWKLGAWRDVHWVQRTLDASDGAPREPS
ncbi:GNAT family N-acetyltransferase [Cellulomonas sp. PhB150]|uniref:GNAT family N-acetyltransferase n=1 Tax=Cellulomonas sp. PhB150 TaxID=2485188 RepID=UPI000FB124A4|nr:GNAT family N-acetyltransferase [Cellulomonas sp. PhB150]ROS27774.1 phosphinothricin acetyltransferase [Cellulomonas sp. PhB150]